MNSDIDVIKKKKKELKKITIKSTGCVVFRQVCKAGHIPKKGRGMKANERKLSRLATRLIRSDKQ